MIQKITTKSGTVYQIANGRCQRGDGAYSYFTLIQKPYCIKNEDLEGVTTWKEIYALEKHPVQVGMCLYVSGRDEWWLSTPITSIEEIEDVEPN